ncbi:hypothetical protein GN244_ATG02846 [Phytophthora infestans]|uniref:Uncharacterized protein n=1 Tax=Phytophthora infestans TaxID=4787 RepID=A0A833T0N0_PHYIN|nr:hypothetical protein GN244_ATG02846 [Phytophthora infestans]KAF4147101.1 hypothetical protein GN958_ATG03730 [Phytophthora infestans]
MLVVAYIYKAEIRMLVAAESDPPVTPTEHFMQLFEVLIGNPDIHPAIFSQDATGCWALLNNVNNLCYAKWAGGNGTTAS